MASTTTAAYSYDANGNLTQKTDATGTTIYLWDYENRLSRVTRPDGVSINYKYDALGRRVERSTGMGQLTKFVYDGQDVIRDIHQDGTTTDYLNGLGVDEKLRQTSAAGVFYFTSDHLGSTTALTDAAGNVVERMSYDAFGNSPPSTRTRYTFTGREYDADTGLYYYRARWYDSQAGRFISEDPIGLAGEDANLYGYVKNNPLNYKDSKGLAGERFNYPEHGLHQDELEDFCKTNDCDLLMSDIQRLEASIHFRDRLERLIYGGLDAGHQQWLDKEVALLSSCWAKYFALGCDKGNCPPQGAPSEFPKPHPLLYPVAAAGTGILLIAWLIFA